jgi:catechol 2,3-dioxygenase-like lactoylglutathione lyase family enzyme
MKKNIVGIQQVGIGVPDVHKGFKWYRQHFGTDIPVFEEAAEANLMLPYTGGLTHKRHAILAINMKGGGGFEIWQYTSRTPQPPKFTVGLGDLGILCARIKSGDVHGSFNFLKSKNVTLLSEVLVAPDNKKHFFLQDCFGNLFEVVEATDWFGSGKQLTGGPAGVMIGVTDMERAKKFYGNLLGYDTVVYEEVAIFDEFKNLPNGQHKIHRTLLKHAYPRSGGFSKLLGDSQIELITIPGYTPKKIFENRYWGDLGFIHLCFDVTGMDDLKRECEAAGHPFTIDSAASFDMGEAAGRFSYIEDPDGTLIEFVETHKIPILKKLGWYLNLRKRDPLKPLPGWMLKAMALNRVAD